MAEATILVVRRLWRAAFASVGASSSSQVKAMVYAFVALVDERLLFDEWPGRTAWQPRPLEARLYGSRTAGERLPRAIHKLLKERAPASRDLANVYLQCLILGFYGGLRSDRGRALHTLAPCAVHLRLAARTCGNRGDIQPGPADPGVPLAPAIAPCTARRCAPEPGDLRIAAVAEPGWALDVA